jgi:hypothetical protein
MHGPSTFHDPSGDLSSTPTAKQQLESPVMTLTWYVWKGQGLDTSKNTNPSHDPTKFQTFQMNERWNWERQKFGHQAKQRAIFTDWLVHSQKARTFYERNVWTTSKNATEITAKEANPSHAQQFRDSSMISRSQCKQRDVWVQRKLILRKHCLSLVDSAASTNAKRLTRIFLHISCISRSVLAFSSEQKATGVSRYTGKMAVLWRHASTECRKLRGHVINNFLDVCRLQRFSQYFLG